MEPTDDFEVYRTFMSIKNSRALDIDNIQIKPVKYVLEFIIAILTHTYDLILQHALFPDKMKRARITVILSMEIEMILKITGPYLSYQSSANV